MRSKYRPPTRAPALVSRWGFGAEFSRTAPLGEALRAQPGHEVARSARIVVAENDADLRDDLGQLLSERWRVELAADGEEALGLARAIKPDLVLADVVMPKLDGLGLLRAIRSDESLEATAVVLVSSRQGEQDRVEGRLAGADDYIPKPFSGRELIARVGAQLALSRLKREVLELNEFRVRFYEGTRLLSDPVEVRAVATRLLGEHLGASRVMYAEIESDEEHVRFESGYVSAGTPEILGRHALLAFGERILEAMQEGETIAIDAIEVYVQSPLERETFAKLGIAALVGVPLIKQGRLLGGIGVHSATPRHWTPREIELIQEIAERTWEAVERARAEAALRESEERFRTLFDTMAEGFSICEVVRNERGAAVDLRWLETNAAMERQTGLPRSALVGRLASEVLPRLERWWYDAYQRVVDSGLAERFELYTAQLGRWFDVTAFPYGGNRLAVIYDDVTERKRGEEALRQSEERQAYLLKLTDALRPLGDSSSIQREACRILRIQLGASSVTYWEMFGEGNGVAAAQDSLPGFPVFLGQRYRLEDFGLTEDEYLTGRVTWRNDIQGSLEFSSAEKAASAALKIGASAVAPLVKEGRLLALFGAYFSSSHFWTQEELGLVQDTADRTWAAGERARAEAALRASEKRARELLADAMAARAQAESANRAKDEFLATLSHELRTPLAAILLWAGALRSGAVPREELARAIDAIVQSAESQSLLVEDLLDLSRLASGKLALSLAPVDVAKMTQAALQMVKPVAIAKRIAMNAEVEAGLAPIVMDGARLKQILWNLLTNATKFTPAGGQVSLRARRRDDQLEVEVVDSGEGISPEFMPHLFEKFWQADMGETRRHMGLGIGLALAKELVELHGGMIEAESEGVGHGAVFRVKLPWIEAEAGTALDAGMRTLSSSSLAGLHVVLVEDDPHTREGMRVALEQAGAQVTAVATGAEALAAIVVTGDTSVLVSDLSLPGLSGFELVERAVQDFGRRGLRPPPSLAVSAHARDVDRQRAIDSGFDMYLAKPITPERLVEAIADLRHLLPAQEA